MNEDTMRALADLEALKTDRDAVITRREGMFAENAHRAECGNSVAYGVNAFQEIADELAAIADKMRKI